MQGVYAANKAPIDGVGSPTARIQVQAILS